MKKGRLIDERTGSTIFETEDPSEMLKESDRVVKEWQKTQKEDNPDPLPFRIEGFDNSDLQG